MVEPSADSHRHERGLGPEAERRVKPICVLRLEAAGQWLRMTVPRGLGRGCAESAGLAVARLRTDPSQSGWPSTKGRPREPPADEVRSASGFHTAPIVASTVPPSVDLLTWLRQQCAEFVFLPAGVYVEQGDHDWPLVAEGPPT